MKCVELVAIVQSMGVVWDKRWVWLSMCLIECSRFEGGDCVGEGICRWSALACTVFNVNKNDTMRCGNAGGSIG